MQTFLPYPGFHRSADVLDAQRLGKQRVETLQILRALELFDYGWSTHPAVRMWVGHTPALVVYGLTFVEVWRRTGRADTTAAMIAEFAPDVVGRTQADLAADGLLPPWLGDERVHLSHRSALLRKNPEFYRPMFGGVPDDLPYFWPEAPAAVSGDDDGGGRRMWVLRASSDEQFAEFRRRRIVGLGSESGIDVHAAVGTLEMSHERGLRALLKERQPSRRPGKDLRVLSAFVTDMAVGDEVAVPVPGDPARLKRAVVCGDYAFSTVDSSTPHRRGVRWSGEMHRSDFWPPAQLQNPRTLFPATVGV